MKSILSLSLIICLFLSCGEIKRSKTVLGYENEIEPVELEKDSSVLEVADIPVNFDSTQYLLHPVGGFSVYWGEKIYTKSGGHSSAMYSVSGRSRDQIHGKMHNILFQSLESDSLTPLTDKNIRIKQVNFLRSVFNSTGQQVLVYRILDADTNGDEVLTDADVQSLYISRVDGQEFRKLTADAFQLINWEELSTNSRLYFRALEDSDKDGKFGKQDQLHYYYIDFAAQDWEVMEYFPL